MKVQLARTATLECHVSVTPFYQESIPENARGLVARLSTSLGYILGRDGQRETGIPVHVDTNAIKDMFLVEDSEGARFDTCLALSG